MSGSIDESKQHIMKSIAFKKSNFGEVVQNVMKMKPFLNPQNTS